MSPQYQPIPLAQIQAEALGALLRYIAVADWYEQRPIWGEAARHDYQALEHFDEAEAHLRKAGRRLLRRVGGRKLLLQAAGVRDPKAKGQP